MDSGEPKALTLVSNILTTILARIATMVLALISSILLARLLGPEGRGLLALVLLLPELIMTFGLFGFESATVVYAGLEPGKRQLLMWHSVATALVVGGVLAVSSACWIALGAPGFPELVRGPHWPYFLLLSIVPGNLVIQYWGALLRGMNQIVLLNVAEVGMKVLSLSLVVVFVVCLRLGVTGAVLASFMLTIGTMVLMIALLIYVGAWDRPSFDWALWKRTGRFALPAYCSSTVGYLHYRIDQFIVVALLSPEQLGYYTIAVDLGERLWTLTGAVGNALLPHLTNSPDRDPALSSVITRHVMFWTGGACLLVFVLADVVVRVIYSSAYIEVVAPLHWLLPGIFISVVWKVLMAEMLAREKIDFTVWTTLAATCVNVVGNFMLVPRMGISGAALASSISYSLMSFLMTWYYLQETRVPWTALMPCRSDLSIYGTLWYHLRAVPLAQK